MRVTWAKVAHQLHLAARSVRDILRDPRRGRGFLRLLATRGRGTMALRLPWLPFPLIDQLAERVGPGSRVFEYGGGGSTLWFLDRGADVVTVEHHAGWAGELRGAVDGPRWQLLERELDAGGADYGGAIEQFADETFDVVLVDGRERARCALTAAAKVRPGGWLVVDDADRERYAAALTAIGWPRVDVVGFAPAKPTLAYSAVLQRPDLDA